MPICQFHEHQIAGFDYTWSGLSGSTTQNIETPNIYSEDAKLFLKNLRASYSNSIIIGYLNIIREKFEMFSSLIADRLDIFMLSETKLNNFTLAQFSTNDFSFPIDLTKMIKVMEFSFM